MGIDHHQVFSFGCKGKMIAFTIPLWKNGIFKLPSSVSGKNAHSQFSPRVSAFWKVDNNREINGMKVSYIRFTGRFLCNNQLIRDHGGQ